MAEEAVRLLPGSGLCFIRCHNKPMAITRIDVSTKSIQQLMDKGEIPSGRYWLPSFQRSYVWDSDKIKELLDSIFRNYPIGSVMLWRPSSRTVSDIDPTAVPLMDISNSSPEPHFIIDGQQRITSLLLMFNGWHIERNKSVVKCDPISYDPTRGIFLKSAHIGIDFSEIIKAFCLYDTEALAELKQKTTPEVFERIRGMAQQLLKYQVSQYIMQTDIEDGKTFKDMANAFIRINKEGVKIGNIELMLSFLAGTVGGDLKKRIVDIDKNMRDRFEAAPQSTLRFIFSNFGLKQNQLSNARRFELNIDHINTIEVSGRDKVLTRSKNALIVVLDFLEKEAGIKNAWFLPSQITLVPLATYIYHRGIISVASLSEDEKRKMLEWFILANFMSHYGTAADSRLNRDLQTITDNTSKYFPFEELIANMPAGRHQISYDDIKKGLDRSVLLDAGKRYLFLLYIFLIRSGVDDWAGRLLSSRVRSDLERHHIFPQEHLRKIFPEWEDDDQDDVEVAMSNLGNITWIPGSVNSAIGASDPVDYLPQYLKSAKHHFVPEDPKYWTKDGYESFKEYRVREIYIAGQRLFKEIFTDENPPVPNPDKKEGGETLIKNGGSVHDEASYLALARNDITDKEVLGLFLDIYAFSKENADHVRFGKKSNKGGKIWFEINCSKADDGAVSIFHLKTNGTMKLNFWGIANAIPDGRGDALSRELSKKLSALSAIKKWYEQMEKEIKQGKKKAGAFAGKNLPLNEVFPDDASLQVFKSAVLDAKNEIKRAL